MNIWQLYTDGASRNNPGAAGAGIYLLKNDCIVEKTGAFLGFKTNNQAEYLALLLGIIYARKHMNLAVDSLIVKCDSELLVKQIKGIYSITNSELKKLCTAVKKNLTDLKYDIIHIPRGENKVADQMANKAIDEKMSISTEILPLWQLYEISD